MGHQQKSRQGHHQVSQSRLHARQELNTILRLNSELEVSLDVLLSNKRAKKPTHLLRMLAAAVKKET
jgi:hypothetical protein